MEWSPIRQRVFAVECFVIISCVLDMQRGLGERKTTAERKCQRALNCSVDKPMARKRLCTRKEAWEKESSDKAWKSVARENCLNRSTCRSARWHTLMSWDSLTKIIHTDLKFHCYKMQLVWQLSDSDKIISHPHTCISIWWRVMSAAVAGFNDSWLVHIGISYWAGVCTFRHHWRDESLH
jgi:hypothetical protein